MAREVAHTHGSFVPGRGSPVSREGCLLCGFACGLLGPIRFNFRKREETAEEREHVVWVSVIARRPYTLVVLSVKRGDLPRDSSNKKEDKDSTGIMVQGTVKWFSPAKGYGFAEPDEGEDDVFLHHSEVPDEDLEEGDRLEFEIEETDKGLSAIEIERVTERQW